MKQLLCLMLILSMGCATVVQETIEKKEEDPFAADNKKFLEDVQGQEAFRVLITPERYQVVQVHHKDTIARNADESGDRYILEEMEQYHKIDETREGVITVWLFPDSGAIMRIRPVQLTFLLELDNLIIQDMQRWVFSFPSKNIDPSRFDVRYRIVLRKKLSDEEIMKQIRDKIKDKTQ